MKSKPLLLHLAAILGAVLFVSQVDSKKLGNYHHPPWRESDLEHSQISTNRTIDCLLGNHPSEIFPPTNELIPGPFGCNGTNTPNPTSCRTTVQTAEASLPTFCGLVVRQPCSFLDKAGIFHGVALSPISWVSFTLESKMQLNEFNHFFRFAFESKTQQAGLFSGQYISIRAVVDDKEVVRFYSPVSLNSDYGHLDLVIKLEENTNNKPMKKFLSNIKPGTTMDFKGPSGGFEYHRNMYREIGMIAGGTGITPMVQIIRSIANHPKDHTHARLIYGNDNEGDALFRDELSYYALTRSNIEVYFSLNKPPSKWSMGVGLVNEGKIKRILPAPADDIIVLLCGPSLMIKAMKDLLGGLGYDDQMIFSFI